jgi:hypothetical protein
LRIAADFKKYWRFFDGSTIILALNYSLNKEEQSFHD